MDDEDLKVTYFPQPENPALDGVIHLKASVKSYEDLKYVKNPTAGDMVNIANSLDYYIYFDNKWNRIGCDPKLDVEEIFNRFYKKFYDIENDDTEELFKMLKKEIIEYIEILICVMGG